MVACCAVSSGVWAGWPLTVCRLDALQRYPRNMLFFFVLNTYAGLIWMVGSQLMRRRRFPLRRPLKTTTTRFLRGHPTQQHNPSQKKKEEKQRRRKKRGNKNKPPTHLIAMEARVVHLQPLGRSSAVQVRCVKSADRPTDWFFSAALRLVAKRKKKRTLKKGAPYVPSWVKRMSCCCERGTHTLRLRNTKCRLFK